MRHRRPAILVPLLLSVLTVGSAAAPTPVPTAPEAPVLDGVIQGLGPDGVTEKGWQEAVRLEATAPDERSRLVVLITEFDGCLWVGFHSELPYQAQHALLLGLVDSQDPARGLYLRYNPWPIRRPLYEEQWLSRTEAGEIVAQPREAMAGFLGRAGLDASSGSWTLELLVTTEALAGTRGLQLGLQLLSEFGPTTLPEVADLEHREGLLAMQLAEPLDGTPPDPRALAAEETRAREMHEVMRTTGMLDRIRDEEGMLRVNRRLLELDPGSILARLQHSDLLARNGRLRESLDLLQELRSSYPFFQALPGAEVVAHRLMASHFWEEARRAFADVPPDNLRRRIDEGMMAYHLGDFQRGLQLLDALVQDPTVVPRKREEIRPFRDHCREYLERWVGEEQAAQARDAAGEPLPRAILHLESGDVLVELFENDVPNTVANFIQLARRPDFYQNTHFHRVQSTVLVQGGCPLTRNEITRDDGLGDPGYHLRAEIGPRKHFRGRLGMASTGLDREGCQFYITVSTAAHLNGDHTVFGRVLEGMELVDTLELGTTLREVEIVRVRDHPYQAETIPLPGGEDEEHQEQAE